MGRSMWLHLPTLVKSWLSSWWTSSPGATTSTTWLSWTPLSPKFPSSLVLSPTSAPSSTLVVRRETPRFTWLSTSSRTTMTPKTGSHSAKICSSSPPHCLSTRPLMSATTLNRWAPDAASLSYFDSKNSYYKAKINHFLLNNSGLLLFCFEVALRVKTYHSIAIHFWSREKSLPLISESPISGLTLN